MWGCNGRVSKASVAQSLTGRPPAAEPLAMVGMVVDTEVMLGGPDSAAPELGDDPITRRRRRLHHDLV